MSSKKNFDLSSILECPFCGSSLGRINDSLFCKCGARFPIINGVVNLLVDITDQEQLDSWEARKLDERKIAPWLSKWTTPLHMNLESIKNKLNGSLALDLGCGPLFPTAPIKLLFKPKRVVSVDFSYHEIKTHGDSVLKTLGVSDEGISRILLDLNANRLPFASSTFDVVLGVFILHHIYP